MAFLDAATVPNGKSYLHPLPSTADPTRYLKATEWNEICADLVALRTCVFAAEQIAFTPSTSRPAAMGAGGQAYRLWVRNSDKALMYYNGASDVALGAGGGGTVDGFRAAYEAASSPLQNIVALTVALGDVQIRDAATPITGTLFSLADSTGTTKYLDASDRGLVIRQRVRAGLSAASALEVYYGAHTNMSAGSEVSATYVDGPSIQFATGALANERWNWFEAPTLGFVGASVVTNAATLYVSGAPIAGTNATITNPYALWVDAGKTRLDGGVTTTVVETASGTPTLTAGASGVLGTITGVTVTGDNTCGTLAFTAGTTSSLAPSGNTAALCEVFKLTFNGYSAPNQAVVEFFPAGDDSDAAAENGAKIFNQFNNNAQKWGVGTATTASLYMTGGNIWTTGVSYKFGYRVSFR